MTVWLQTRYREGGGREIRTEMGERIGIHAYEKLLSHTHSAGQEVGFHTDSWMHSHLAGQVTPVWGRWHHWSGLWTLRYPQ